MISVIIPVYNGEKTIEQALDSVMDQSCFELIGEIIIIDDGSTDGTVKVVDQYKNEVCSPDKAQKIKLLRQTNAGPAAARNYGMREAKEAYIAFLDADDSWAPYKIEHQARILEEHPQIDLLCGGMQDGALRILLRKHRELYGLSLKEYCIKSVIFTSTVVIRKERLEETGYFDETMKYCEDMNLYQRFFPWGQVYYMPEKLVSYGIEREYYGQSGLSSHLKEMNEGRKQNFKILRKEHKISFVFYMAMMLFSEIKLLRRKIIVGNTGQIQ